MYEKNSSAAAAVNIVDFKGNKAGAQRGSTSVGYSLRFSICIKKPVQAGTHMYTHLHMCTFRRTHTDVQNMLNVVTSVELINPHVFRLKQIKI